MVAGSAPTPSVLRRLLQAAGYRLDDLPGVTVAVRGVDHRAVVFAARGRSPAEVESAFPPNTVHRTIVYEEEPGDAAREAAAQRGIELLDPSTLGPALGELLLPSALVPGAGGAPGVDDELLESPFPPVAAGALTVRPRIDRREAQALAGLPGARYTLRLVPFYVAAYRVRAAAPAGGRGPVQRRLVAVNATTRRAETWDEGARELVASVDGPSERLSPQLTESGAVPIALEAIRRFHTVRVDHTEQHAGAIVVESRRVPPSSEDVRLGPFSLIFVPYWYAESAEGRRVLDAVSGRGPVDADARAP
ncbi:MAG TPA: hypothetical protein VEH10_02175 [Thermoplasmata archaeon]|nr:hypothetical protein [Thermoplasmata archaeon]